MSRADQKERLGLQTSSWACRSESYCCRGCRSAESISTRRELPSLSERLSLFPARAQPVETRAMRLGRTLEANMIILLQLRPRRLPGVEKGQDTAAGSQLHHSYSRCTWNATRSYTMSRTMTDSPQTWHRFPVFSNMRSQYRGNDMAGVGISANHDRQACLPSKDLRATGGRNTSSAFDKS